MTDLEIINPILALYKEYLYITWGINAVLLIAWIISPIVNDYHYELLERIMPEGAYEHLGIIRGDNDGSGLLKSIAIYLCDWGIWQAPLLWVLNLALIIVGFMWPVVIFIGLIVGLIYIIRIIKKV